MNEKKIQIVLYFAEKNGGTIGSDKVTSLLYITNREYLFRYMDAIIFEVIPFVSDILQSNNCIRIVDNLDKIEDYDRLSIVDIEILDYVWERHGHQTYEELKYYIDNVFFETKKKNLTFFDILNELFTDLDLSQSIHEEIIDEIDDFKSDHRNAAPEKPKPRFTVPDDESRSPFHIYKPKGGFTLEKIKRHLRTNPSLSSGCSLEKLFDNKGRSNLAKEIKKFASAEEFEKHLFWHGTGGYISGGLKPGSILPKGTIKGGGYDEPYSVISVSRSKDIASIFTGVSRSGKVHPVIVRKGAKFVSMPDVSDSQELEDILPEIWSKGIDVIKIGDWEHSNSEQELCVINPRAVIIGGGQTFQVFNKQKFENPTFDQIQNVYDRAVKGYKE